LIPYEFKKLVLEAAKKSFTNTPEFVTKRIIEELEFLEKQATGKDATRTGNYWRANYLLRSLLAKRKNRSAYVLDNGLNGNLLIGYLLGLSEIVPLPPFYYCSQCSHYELGPKEIISGYSLPTKLCPECSTKMIGMGIDISLNENSLDSASSVGLKVSKKFLKRNHLDMYGSFNRKIDRRDCQSFTITIANAVIKIDESLDVAIIEKMVDDYEINILNIDYNDKKVFRTIFGDNNFGLHIIGNRLFHKISNLVGQSTSFDEFIRLMGFYLGPSCNSENVDKFSKNHNRICLAGLPTNHEDLNKALADLGIENQGLHAADKSAINNLLTLKKQTSNQESLTELIDYMKTSVYFERKCKVITKTLLIYRIAYLKTYHPELFMRAIGELGYSKVSIKEMKRAVSRAKLNARIIGKEASNEELLQDVAHHLKNYVDWQSHSYREQFELFNLVCKD